MKIESLLSYDNVYLRPTFSELDSRSNADVSVDLCGCNFKSPIIPANMTDVVSFQNAKLLSDNGYFYIMHRFESATIEFTNFICENDIKLISLSIGINDDSKNDLNYVIKKLSEKERCVNFLCIDVAHGHHKKVKNMIVYVKKLFRGFPKTPKLIVGNVATSEGYTYLADCGVDIIKCGIGQGSICTTKYKTGFHLPTLHSVYECASLGLGVPIIADGGAKHYGDIAKALTLGATMVMSGGWFASCIDSPAKIEHGMKIYRGSTSYEVKNKKSHIEGRTLEIDQGCTYSERMTEIEESLKSSISYAGGKDLSIFKTTKWHQCL